MLAAAALPLVLAACSGGSSSDATTTTRPTGHQGTTSVCTLVTPAQIESALARKVGAPGVANSTAATTCTYPGADGRSADSVIITFRSRVTAAEAGAEQASLEKIHGTLTPVTVSDGQAFSFTTGSGAGQVTSLVTLVGTTQVSIAATAPLDRIENLSVQIFTTLSTGATTTTTAAGSTATTAAP